MAKCELTDGLLLRETIIDTYRRYAPGFLSADTLEFPRSGFGAAGNPYWQNLQAGG